jgi:hypothetical protein
LEILVHFCPFPLSAQTDIDDDMNTAESGKIRFTQHADSNDAGRRGWAWKQSCRLAVDQFSVYGCVAIQGQM